MGANQPGVVAGDRGFDARPTRESNDAREQSKEYKVKAAFLYNFISYTTWEKGALPPESKPFVVAVVGPNPFGSDLEKLLSSRKAHGRAIVAKHYLRLPEKLEAHVVFTAEPDPLVRAQILLRTKTLPVLVIGEHPDIALEGAHVGFYLDQGKVRFEVNLEALRTSKLTMSSQLLKLAKIVKK